MKASSALRREGRTSGVGRRGPRERVSESGCRGPRRSREEAQREMDDFTDADFMYRDEGE
jgi:hypothetical protein